MKKRIYTLSLIAAVVLTAMLLSLSAPAAPSAEPTRYGRTTISAEPNTAYVYDTLVQKLLTASPEAEVELDRGRGVTETQLAKAFDLFLSDYPECFWLGSAYQYGHIEETITSIHFNFTFSGNELAEAREDLEYEVSNMLSGMPSTSNYDKALYLHDKLCKNVIYEMVGDHQTAYGALVSGKAVCAGYARAYQLLLQRAGIDAWTVTGDSVKPGEAAVPHAWNLVWLEDGVCVYTDPTWNDDEDGLYHSYFNISKAEISTDHIAEEIFTLPACSHDDKSYFDVNDRGVSLSTTVEEFASMFGPEQDGKKTAVVYYEGADTQDFNDWLNDNQLSIYDELSCDPYEDRSYRLSIKGSELHITVSASFPSETYKVSISAPSSLTSYEDGEQFVVIGQPMDEMTYVAASGYYFPSTYRVSAPAGFTVTRVSAREIKISGTPTKNTVITLSAATKMQRESAPNAVYTPDGNGDGTLSGVSEGMKYSFDGVNWINITSSADIALERITSDKIFVVRSGNGESTLDSAAQMLAVTNTYVAPPTAEDTSAADKDNSAPDAQSPVIGGSNSGNGIPVGGCFSSAEGTAIILIMSLALCTVFVKKKKTQ